MKLVQLIEFLRARLKTVVYICYGVLATLVICDYLFVDKEHAHTGVEHWFGWWSIFGFGACVAIILVSKWYGHCGIMKREDYYDE